MPKKEGTVDERTGLRMEGKKKKELQNYKSV